MVFLGKSTHPMKKYYIVAQTPVGIRHSVREMDETEAAMTRGILEAEGSIILFATEDEISAVQQCLASEAIPA